MSLVVVLLWLVPVAVLLLLHSHKQPTVARAAQRCRLWLQRARAALVRHRKAVRCAALVACALAGVWAVRTAADILALHLQRAPTELAVAVDVAPLAVADRRAPRWFYHFNPSVAVLPRADGTALPVVAMREASLHNCPTYGAWLNPARFLHVSSRIVLGVAARGRGVGGPYRVCSVLEKRERTPNTLYQGIDDARLFVYHGPCPGAGAEGAGAGTGTECPARLGATIIINNHMFVSRFAVDYKDSGNSTAETTEAAGAEEEEAPCSIRETHRAEVHVAGTARGTKEKNWMYVPDSAGAPRGAPRFVQWLNPLAVVDLDLATGEAAVVSRGAVRACVPRRLRGSTNLLPHPTRPRVFVGLAHEKTERYPPIVISFFTTRVVAVEERADGSYALAAVSHAFRLPVAPHAATAHRIQYPMSLAYTDAARTTVSVAMGYMDCTAHTLYFNTTDLLSLLRPLDC